MDALDQLTKISLIKKIAVLVVVAVLLAIGYWTVYYGDLSDELDNLKNKHSDILKQKEDALRRKSTYDKDRHRRDELKKSYAQQLRALPSDAEMSSFLNSLNSQAELVGLELQAVKPEKEAAAQYYARIPVKLKLRGNFLQMAKFFYLIGNVDRIINIENISFRVDAIDESGIQLSADVLATTFRSIEGDAAKAKQKKKGKA
ncbi:MAG: type 4a pilus biogenesis protein PilO [Proteobacteria bacterium]|nr:type 4a pilus biogenesis protein PilO [Pseudomonadota bacterium]